MVSAKKDFWEHLKFDNENKADLNININLDNSQLDKLKAGFIPDDISSRYLAYFENEILFIHSIMGGDCYYELQFDINLNGLSCSKIRKYIRFRPDESIEEETSFLKSFLKYSLNIKILD
jgi:hypothetical protein